MVNQVNKLADLRSRFSSIPASARGVLLDLVRDGTDAQTLSGWYATVRAIVESEQSLPLSMLHGSRSAADELSLHSTLTSTLSPATVNASTSVYLCPVCWNPKPYKHARDCKRHAEKHWLTLECPIEDCSYSDVRRDHFTKHVHHGHPGKSDRQTQPVKRVTDQWTNLSCGICELLFEVTPMAGETLQVSMTKTFNDYMGHVSAHFENGSTRQDWSHVKEAKGLLCQPEIALVWDLLYSLRFGCQNTTSWPDLNWTEAVAEHFLQSMREGTSVADPWDYIPRLLDALCASASPMQSDVQSAAPDFSCAMPADQWTMADDTVNTGLTGTLSDSDTFAMYNTMAPSDSHRPNAVPSGSEVHPTATTDSTVVVEYEALNAQLKYNFPLPPGLNDLAGFQDERELTTQLGYTGLHMTGNPSHSGFEGMPDLPAAQDETPFPHPPQTVIPELEGNQSDPEMAPPATTTTKQAAHSSGNMYGEMPASLPYNPTPPLPWHRGHKRTRSSLDHIKRISGGWFRRR